MQLTQNGVAIMCLIEGSVFAHYQRKANKFLKKVEDNYHLPDTLWLLHFGSVAWLFWGYDSSTSEIFQ